MSRSTRFMSPEFPDRSSAPLHNGSSRGEDVHAGLSALPEVALHFHQRLMHVPIGKWAEVAADDANGDHASSRDPDARARHRLRRIMDEYPDTVVRMRRRIEDTIDSAEGFVSRRMLPRMKRVALTAGLALVAKSQLASDDFARLYRPFEDLIPERELPA